MTHGFKVKVMRVYESEHGQVLDGWFISDVYAIERNKFLVYDDGSGSSDDEATAQFVWIYFSDTWTEHWPDGAKRSVVELWEDRYD